LSDDHSFRSDEDGRPEKSLERSAGAAVAPPPGDRFAARLRGFGPVGILAMLVILAVAPTIAPLSALLVLGWAYRSRTPWREIGYVRPRSWIGAAAVGIVFGCAFKILMPLLGAPPINPAFHYLAGSAAALPVMLFNSTVVAGFGEETVYRGYLFERLGKLCGRGVGAKVAILVLTSVWFGLTHYPVQGLAGAEQATITGLVFGTIFALTGSLWMPMFAHAAFDVTAVLIIYWDLESYVAHLVFR
jgi:CAAX protease family protein